MMKQLPDPLAGEQVQVRNGVTLQVCYHAGEAPAIVFLHGGLGNRFNWRSQYEFFSAQGWQTLVYDLAGHGQSPPYSRYSIGRHGRDLKRLLNILGIQMPPILCCHSYGVPIGLEWVQRRPTSGLILISGGTHDLDPWWEIPLMKLLTWGGRHLYQLPLAQRLTRDLASSHTHETVQRFFGESPVPVELHPYQALRIFWGYDFFKRHKTDRHKTVPTLVISGGQDSMFNRAMGDELASQFSISKHLHFPDAGHVVMAEYPDVVNEAIAFWAHQCGFHSIR